MPEPPQYLADHLTLFQPDVVPLLRVNDDAKVFKQHHVVLKINNRLRRPGMNHLGRQLTIKHGTPTSSSQFYTKAQADHIYNL